MSKTLASVKGISWTRWLVLALVLTTVVISGTGWWQVTGVGPQVQTPMFYDDHYVYPRPWTQEQSAPGIPDPAPIPVLYENNQLRQSFVSRTDNLSLIKVWLRGPAGTPVEVMLETDDARHYKGEVTLKNEDGQYVFFRVPSLIETKGRTFSLVLAAPSATSAQPVSTRIVGGDRLGGSHYLNEYPRPGNLELYTYSRGFPGAWSFKALGEQLLPAVFATRLQQYKPEPFKGASFSILLGFSLVLSGAFLLLSWPGQLSMRYRLGRFLLIAIAAFMVTETLTGRLLLPGQIKTISLEAGDGSDLVRLVNPNKDRLVYDLSMLLWTADREPEARFFQSTYDPDGRSVIEVPPLSAIHYSLIVPLNCTFTAGLQSGSSGGTRFSVWANDLEIAGREVSPVTGVVWVDLDLSSWAGQNIMLTLKSEPTSNDGEQNAHWVMPQLSSRAEWLSTELPVDSPNFRDVNYTFSPPGSDQLVTLVGYEVDTLLQGEEETLEVTLFWKSSEQLDRYATVFVHLLDEQNQIKAQHDGQPVQGTYPLPSWMPGFFVSDSHYLASQSSGNSTGGKLAVGLYDPDSKERWTTLDSSGLPLADNKVTLTLPSTFGAGP